MSHLARVQVKVTDLEVLEIAGQRRGLDLLRGVTRFTSYNGQNRCDHVLQRQGHQSGDYQIGVVPSSDGIGWDLSFDNYGSGRHLEAVAGRGLVDLKHEIGAEIAMRDLARQGFTVQRQIDTHGRVRVIGDR